MFSESTNGKLAHKNQSILQTIEVVANMDLSIIIPVYNGAATIGRCLDSIYAQGLDEKQYEVICVDDCSPDPFSVAAIDNYKYKGCDLIKEKISYINNQENTTYHKKYKYKKCI